VGKRGGTNDLAKVVNEPFGIQVYCSDVSIATTTIIVKIIIALKPW
jgi:hypothetical protein